MTTSMSAHDWLDAATGGTINDDRLLKYGDAHIYIAQRLLRLWDVPIDGIAPADVFSSEWTADEEQP
jgi:hypothetical protein